MNDEIYSELVELNENTSSLKEEVKDKSDEVVTSIEGLKDVLETEVQEVKNEIVNIYSKIDNVKSYSFELWLIIFLLFIAIVHFWK